MGRKYHLYFCSIPSAGTKPADEYPRGTGMNARLNMELRERRGLVYNVEASYTPSTPIRGLFSVYWLFA